MTTYETAVLFDPEVPEDGRKDFLGKVEGVVSSFGGEILKQDDWGIRKLAYPIRKKHNAYYTFLIYSGKPGVVEEVERNLKISDAVMRHLTTCVEFEAKPAAAEPPPGEGSPAAETGEPPSGTAPGADEAPPA